MSDQADDQVRRELRELRETPVDAVALRRVRTRLFRGELARVPVRSRRVTAGILLAGVASLLLVGATALLLSQSSRPTSSVAPIGGPSPAASSIASVEAGNAKWTSTIDDVSESIVLDDGTLRLHVSRKPSGRRVVVRVPDGEIEDIGTVFEVRVEDHRTVAVRVESGRVMMRLATAPPLTLEAGQSWARPTKETPRNVPAAVTKHDVKPAEQAPPAPHEPRGEDAAYLAFIRALRAGDTNAARERAAAYLNDFPAGFRRDEVQRFVAEQPEPEP